MQIKEINKDFIFFTSETKQAIALGADYLKGKNAWRLPINLHTINDLLKHTITPDLLKLQKTLQNYYTFARDTKRKLDTNGDDRLRPYQRVDIEYIQGRQSVGIFNEQRTGKTPTTIVADKDSKKRVIVCPSGLRLNWEREIKRWIGAPNVFVAQGTPAVRAKIYKNYSLLDESTLILSYETLRQDILKLPFDKFDSLIVDEAHRLRNYQSKQSRAVITLSESAYKVYALTGTPAVNHPSDIFGIFKLLKPTKYTSYWNFVGRYFSVYDGHFSKEVGGFRNDRKDEFLQLVEVQSTQRKRRDVMKWLPKIEEREIHVPATPEQKRLFDEIMNMSRYNGNVIPNAVAQLMRLRQVSLAPKLLGVDAPSPKEDFILEYIEDNPNESIIVFSLFTSFLKMLKDKLGNRAVMLTGEQSQEEKQSAVDAIQNGSKKIMLANIIAGGVGWTLDKAETIIFTDISYNPMDNAQARDRFVATNPNLEYDSKQVIYLLTEKSIDSAVHLLVEKKIDIIKYVNDYGLKNVLNNNTQDYNVDERKR